MGEVKEWVKISRSANNQVSVSCTLQRGAVTVRWAVKAYSNTLKEGLVEARNYAKNALSEIEAVL